MADPKLVVTGDPAAAARTELGARLSALVAKSGRARLAIPGGSALAALEGLRGELGDTWSKIALTWVDERCVPFDSPDSNRGEAHRSGALDRSQPPAIELPLFEEGEEPADAAARVERQLRERFDAALDVTLLGMGPDGHVASLFPGRPAEPGLASWVRESPKPPANRITLTRAVLATASSHVVVALGESKRPALVRLLAGDASLPAVGLRGLIVFTDLDVSEVGR